MKKDKLTLKAEIQNIFENKSVDTINTNIKLYGIMKFLHAESTIFCISLIPTLAMIAYYFVSNPVNVGASIGIVLLLVHFIIYRTLFKKVLFKDVESEYNEFKYTIEVLEEIKADKMK